MVTKDTPGFECDLSTIYTNEDMLYCLQDELRTIQVPKSYQPLKHLDEVMLDTHQSKALVVLQQQYFSYLELTFIISPAVKALSNNDLIEFFEFANYYINLG